MIFLILGLVCAGCVNKNGQMLSLAAGCMEVAPDSAMSILEKWKIYVKSLILSRHFLRYCGYRQDTSVTCR